MPMRVDSRLLK